MNSLCVCAFQGGTSQNEVMGVGIANDHALRSAQGRATLGSKLSVSIDCQLSNIHHGHLMRAGHGAVPGFVAAEPQKFVFSDR